MGNKKSIRSAVTAAFLLILVLLSTFSVAAEDPTPPSVDGGESILLYDKTHSKYIVEKNAYAIVNTSTSAKIMTGLIACEMLSERLDERVTITAEMISETAGYSMKLKVGESLTVRDLLYGAICGSYNDAAYAIAHICGGNTSGFVSLMNTKAASLNAKNTSYTNPLGYPDNSAMTTTAYDTLKIAIAASDNPLFMDISSAIKYSVPATNLSEERQFYNRNYLISSAAFAGYYNSDCKGMNAGYSGAAGGWSIVTLAQDDGADYICIILGGKENEDGSRIYAYESVNTLVDWAMYEYNNYTVFPAGAQLGTTPVGLTGLSTDAPYIMENDLTIYIPKNNRGDIEYTIDLDDDIKAPITAGTKIGVVTVTRNGIKIGEGNLIIKESYEINSIMLIIDKIGSYTTSRAFIATIICFAVLLTAVILWNRNKKYDSPKARYRRMR